MERDGDDPFDSLIPLCHVSSSQEERLRRCPFAPEPYNPRDDASPLESDGGGIWIASTPIMMVSLPESEEEDADVAAAAKSREDEFVTPPEEAAVSSSGEFRLAANFFGCDSGLECDAAVQAVDLSRDSDLGFEAVRGKSAHSDANRLESEVLEENTDLSRLNLEVEVPQTENLDSIRLNFGAEMAQRQNLASKADQSKSELEMSQRENLDSEVELTRRENVDFDPNQLKPDVSETESKGIRVLTRELTLESGLGESALKRLKVTERNSEEPNEESEALGANLTDNGFDFVEEAEINSNRSSAKRKLELGDDPVSAETFRLENETNNGRERISADEFIDAMNGADEREDVVAVELRRPPNSMLGRSGNVEEEVEGDKGCNEMTIFDVLKLLTEDCLDDAPSCSFLEICKGRGMVFPRPAWWPERRAGFGDDDMEVGSF